MSLREADIVEYYIRSLEGVKDVKVYDRTQDAIVTFTDSSKKNKKAMLDALLKFDYEDEEILALVPEETGRALNRQFEEKIIFMLAGRVLRRLFLPAPLHTIRCVIRSIPFIWQGLKCLFKGKMEVSLLDATAILASMIRGDFKTAASVMFLLKLGETLEDFTRKKSIGDLARSMALNVDKVWVKTDSTEVLTPVDKVHVGDKIIVRDSNIIPLDGVVVSGEMTVNQATMTGEAEPVPKSAGISVFAGTVVEEGECVIEVTKESGSGRYDQIVKMIDESEKLKSNTEAKAYMLADNLVPYSFAGAALTFLLTRNVVKSLAFMMVDYSCAMKLSMPLAVLSAIREAREDNISVKGGKFMEAVAEADTIVFDKTGTLTHATPTLVDVVAFSGKDPDEMLRIAACLEEHYPHSVANAVVNGALKKNLTHDELHSKVQYVVAHGVSSFIDGEKVVIGSYHFVIEDEKCEIPAGEEEKLEKIKPEYSRLFLAIGGKLVAVLCIFDPLREEAREVVDKLHELGIKKVVMMTGDNRKTAKGVAKKLNLDEYYAEVLPEDKADFIRNEHLAGRKVIMVGDGVNDTPALSEADVGIAISDGAAIAREIADITVSSANLNRLVTLRKLSMALMDRIHGNYRFIIGFNSLLIALGVGGVLNPASSALLHNGSTIYTGIKSTTNLLPKNDK